MVTIITFWAYSDIGAAATERQAWFLTVVNGEFYVRNIICMSQETSVSILKYLTCLEGFRLLGVSRASSKESKRTCLVPDCSQLWIPCHKCCLLVSRKLCINFEVSNLLRRILSFRCLQSVLQGVFWGQGSWWLILVKLKGPLEASKSSK